MQEKIGAVIVSYLPEEPLQIENILNQVDHLVVVDNSPSNSGFLENIKTFNSPNFSLIELGSNQGQAKALNIGLNHLLSLEMDWALTLDQDSLPPDNLVKALRSYLEKSNNKNIAIVGPQIVDINIPDKKCKYLSSKNKFKLDRVDITKQSSSNLLAIITSGALTNLQAWKNVGEFREDLFIDYVDIEFCLRLKSFGFDVAAVNEIEMQHCLGQRAKKNKILISGTPTNHNSLRRYYIARNSVVTLKKYAFKYPSWAMFESLNQLLTFYRVIFFEEKRIDKLKHIFLGYSHGILGKLGPFQSRRNS